MTLARESAFTLVELLRLISAIALIFPCVQHAAALWYPCQRDSNHKPIGPGVDGPHLEPSLVSPAMITTGTKHRDKNNPPLAQMLVQDLHPQVCSSSATFLEVGNAFSAVHDDFSVLGFCNLRLVSTWNLELSAETLHRGS
jgi:hypothetical protein